MNVEQLIQEVLSGETLGKLGSLIGEGEGKTRAAAGAAVPALLSALSGAAASAEGTQKLADVVGKFQSGAGDLAGMFTEQAETFLEQGNMTLKSLLDGDTIATIAKGVARFTSLNAEKIKNLLGLLTPLVLAAIAKQFSGQGITAQGLAGLFADQKAAIARAVPAGLLVPGLAGSAPMPAGSKLLISLLGAFLAALTMWYFFFGPGKKQPPPATGSTESKTAN